MIYVLVDSKCCIVTLLCLNLRYPVDVLINEIHADKCTHLQLYPNFVEWEMLQLYHRQLLNSNECEMLAQ